MSISRTGPFRSEAARRVILESTAQLFQERGYGHLTIEGIAARAGVGKQTIYRWWRSKGALVAECLLEGLLLPDRLEVPNTGDVRRDLAAWLEEISRLLAGSDGEGLLRSLVAAAVEDAEVGTRLRDSLTGSASVAGRLTAAIGQSPHLRDGDRIDEMAEALVGAVILRALSRSNLERPDIDRLLDVVLGR